MPCVLLEAIGIFGRLISTDHDDISYCQDLLIGHLRIHFQHLRRMWLVGVCRYKLSMKLRLRLSIRYLNLTKASTTIARGLCEEWNYSDGSIVLMGASEAARSQPTFYKLLIHLEANYKPSSAPHQGRADKFTTAVASGALRQNIRPRDYPSPPTSSIPTQARGPAILKHSLE